MQSGGSTKPWRVVAISDEGGNRQEVAYVVKTFTATQVKQANNIAKEFICNALAAQFDLDVPEACLINLHDEDFKATLGEAALSVLTISTQGTHLPAGCWKTQL